MILLWPYIVFLCVRSQSDSVAGAQLVSVTASLVTLMLHARALMILPTLVTCTSPDADPDADPGEIDDPHDTGYTGDPTTKSPPRDP